MGIFEKGQGTMTSLRQSRGADNIVMSILNNVAEAGCSQEEGPKKGFVMGSRTRGVPETLEKCI